jgi:hypothetical protein
MAVESPVLDVVCGNTSDPECTGTFERIPVNSAVKRRHF